MSATLILTATVAPPSGVPGLVRTDPELRLRDYLESLAFYLNLPTRRVGRIVFAENSGSDLTPLRDLARRQQGDKQVEFVGFAGLDHPASYGRGYGEFKLLDHVLAQSELIAALPPMSVLWKGTGRYRLINLPQLIATAPTHYDLYCDLKSRPMPWMDLRFFSCTVRGYQRFLSGVYRELREDVIQTSPEVHMRLAIGGRLGQGGIVPRFRTEPYVEGVRGWDNRHYAQGWNRMKYLCRVAARRVAPWAWI
jgi:hypothetical protein